MRLMSFLNRLRRSESGVALIEFAYSMPIFLSIGVAGIEVADMAVTRMQVAQIALGAADNAARLGQTDNGAVAPTVREADVDALLKGTAQEASNIDLIQNGRIILSSIEYDNDTGRQYIRWQRCIGDLARSSAYGDDGSDNGKSGSPLPKIGKSSNPVEADADNAVMLVEVFYEHEGLFSPFFISTVNLNREATFLVRDDRDLVPGLTGGASASPCTPPSS